MISFLLCLIIIRANPNKDPSIVNPVVKGQMAIDGEDSLVKAKAGFSPFQNISPSQTGFVVVFLGKLFPQIKLLLWKRFSELKAQPSEVAKIVLVPFLFFVLTVLVYQLLPVVLSWWN